MSSGGTAKAISDAGLPVVTVADITGSPEMSGHRVVTLHPKIHGGILADCDAPEHLRDLEVNEIEPIDLVVSNLYPFGADPSVEMIDIGGPAMVRAAAKNHADVGVVVDPTDYDKVLEQLRRRAGLTQRPGALARKAFSHTSAYDSAIVSWLDGDELLPPTIHLALERTDDVLEYGENPISGQRLPGHAGFSDRRERADLVGLCDPQKRDSLVLPEHLRRRRGDATRVRPRRRAGGRHRQAREPVWRGGSRTSRPPINVVRVRRAVRVRRGGRSQPSRGQSDRRAHGLQRPRPT